MSADSLEKHLLRSQRKYEAAKEMHQRTLELKEKVLGVGTELREEGSKALELR